MKRRYIFGIGLLLSVLLLLSSIAFAQVINNGVNGLTVNPAGCNNCRTVSNNFGQALFFNEQLCSDWQSFISYPPSGVTFGSCCTPHASRNCPVQGGAVYWYNSCGQQEEASDGCPAGGNYCGGGNVRNTPGGCIQGTTACIDNLVQTCSGAFCYDGMNKRTYTGCSGGACTQSGSTYCSGGCTGGGSCLSCNSCYNPAPSTWYVDYGVYLFYGDSSCSTGWYWQTGTVSGDYSSWVEPAHAILTGSIDTGNSCFYFYHIGSWARAYSRSPIYDNGVYYSNNCGQCGGTYI